MHPFVALIVATYRRAPELRRLLTSLEGEQTPFAVLVVDNADDADTRAAVEEWAGGEAHWLSPGGNLGCGGGLAFGERAALERYGSRLTHLWMLDDDAVVHPGALSALLTALADTSAALACPMIVNAQGHVGWPPGLQNRAALRAIVAGGVTPERYREVYGSGVAPFSWATGVCLIATRESVETLGPHREDFWIRGEDLEFSLRYTARQPGVYVPTALVGHLPPEPATPTPQSLAAERAKHGAMVQNAAYIASRLPHGRRILRSLPGNAWRYLRTWGLGSGGTLCRALWAGAVRGQPAGVGGPFRA